MEVPSAAGTASRSSRFPFLLLCFAASFPLVHAAAADEHGDAYLHHRVFSDTMVGWRASAAVPKSDQELEAWSDAAGIHKHGVRIASFTNQMILEPGTSKRPLSLRGMVATEHVQSGDLLVSVPDHLLLCNATAWRSEPLGSFLRGDSAKRLRVAERLSEHDSITLLVMQEYAKHAQGKPTPWSGYLESLIPRGGVAKPSRDVLEHYGGRKNDMITTRGLNFRSLFELFPDVFPPEYYTLGYFAAARHLCRTRAFGIKSEVDEEGSLSGAAGMWPVLVPIADLFNHRTLSGLWDFKTSNTSLQGKSTTSTLHDGAFNIYSMVAADPGDQLYVEYGAKSSESFAKQYGFVPEDNMAETATGKLSLDSIRGLEQTTLQGAEKTQKIIQRVLWVKKNKELMLPLLAQNYSLSLKDGIPADLIRVARLMTFSAEEQSSAACLMLAQQLQQAVGFANEVRSRIFLRDLVQLWRKANLQPALDIINKDQERQQAEESTVSPAAAETSIAAIAASSNPETALLRHVVLHPLPADKRNVLMTVVNKGQVLAAFDDGLAKQVYCAVREQQHRLPKSLTEGPERVIRVASVGDDRSLAPPTFTIGTESKNLDNAAKNKDAIVNVTWTKDNTTVTVDSGTCVDIITKHWDLGRLADEDLEPRCIKAPVPKPEQVKTLRQMTDTLKKDGLKEEIHVHATCAFLDEWEDRFKQLEAFCGPQLGRGFRRHSAFSVEEEQIEEASGSDDDDDEGGRGRDNRAAAATNVRSTTDHRPAHNDTCEHPDRQWLRELTTSATTAHARECGRLRRRMARSLQHVAIGSMGLQGGESLATFRHCFARHHYWIIEFLSETADLGPLYDSAKLFRLGFFWAKGRDMTQPNGGGFG